MARQVTESRVARAMVERNARTPVDPNTRHGSEDVAKTCRCEVCRRAYPDAKKRDRIAEKARKTNACTRGGVKGHPACRGWRFAPFVNVRNSQRGASPCTCLCHTDGRGAPIPALDEYLAELQADRAAYLAREAAVGASSETTGEPK